MPEVCPGPGALAAFLDGHLAPGEAEAVQAHLSICLDCARKLDELTSAQLAAMGAAALADAPDSASEPAVAELILANQMQYANPGQRVEAVVLAALDAPGRSGSLGRFGTYELLEIVGRGGMGVVLKAYDSTLNRLVAVKVLPPASRWTEEAADRFLQEARAIASIQHDHVVAIYSAGSEKGFPYIVMPFHAEGTLEDWLKRTPQLKATEVALVGLHLARALALAHEKGVLHCDIKPSNVLLEGGLTRVRLADFGLARPIHPMGLDLRTPIAGTPQYMPPEQARGGLIDARSDLFGLGALLFRLATGRTVHEGESAELVLHAAIRFQPTPVRMLNPRIPVGLAVIIDRLLKPQPAQRYASAAEVVAALERFVGASVRRSRWMRRATAGAMAVILLLSGGLLLSDLSGKSAVINTLLCRRRGDGFYVRGRLGTYTRLPDAITAARANDVIEVCFSGERLMGSFFVQKTPITIRAAPGCSPVLIATNNGDPFIQATVPLTLEGLTIWRRGPVVNFSPLLLIENAPLNLLNCRFVRSRYPAQKILVWGKLAALALNEPQRLPMHRAMLAFEPGSSGHLRNCILAGTMASAIAVRATTNQPTRIEIDSSLLETDATFALQTEPVTCVRFQCSHCAVVTAALLDFDIPEQASGITVTLADCFLERSLGTVVRTKANGVPTLQALRWTQTNVVYAGEGSWAVDRRKTELASEAEWNEWLVLHDSSRSMRAEYAFPATCVRSSLGVSATDLSKEALNIANGGEAGFNPQFIGEGSAYEKLRQAAGYHAWQTAVQARSFEWQRRGAANAAANPRSTSTGALSPRLE